MPAHINLPRGLLHRHAGGLMTLLRLADLTVVGMAAWLAYLWRFEDRGFDRESALLVLLAVLLAALVFPAADLYHEWRGRSRLGELRQVLGAWAVLLALLLLYLYFSKQAVLVSRIWIGVWFVSGASMTMMLRLVMREGFRGLRKRGYNTRSLLLLGDKDRNREIREHLSRYPDSGYRVAALVAVPRLSVFPERSYNEDGVVQTDDGFQGEKWRHELRGHFAEQRIDQLWITLPLLDFRRIRHLLDELEDLPCGLRWVPDPGFTELLEHGLTRITGLPVISFASDPMQEAGAGLKTAFDFAFSLGILILLSPLLCGIALVIKLGSPGPVFFRQWRHGLNGKPVEVWKFRTMYDSDESSATFVQAHEGDSRVTPFGRFLRRTSLDELPQFFNVLQGRLSVVGPRPHPLPLNLEHKRITKRFMHRHAVKPGITGWAQVNGWRGETGSSEKMQKRVEHDLWYIEHWSFWLDMKIIFITIFRAWSSPNAY